MVSPNDNDTSSIGVIKLLEMQKQLMEKVPHKLKPEVYSEVMCVKDIIEKSLLFLASLGHKPWRPIPLSSEEQQARLETLSRSLDMLLIAHSKGFKPTLEGKEYDRWTRKLISAFGVIEEILEYLDCPEDKEDEHRLEEITDPLFFYLEMVILSGFTWEQIEAQYVRKHAENLERYRKAKEGDYSWDKRSEGKL